MTSKPHSLLRAVAATACLLFSATAAATDSLSFTARAGFSVGATAPLAMPATVSSVDAFRITPSFQTGLDATLPLHRLWGLSAGLRLEHKAMDADITAKGYRMELRQGAEQIGGLFTGHVSQQVQLWMLTLPLRATFAPSEKLRLSAGPYLSVLLSKQFSGTASDGYLRKGSATGPRIVIGNTPESQATYDFSDQLRRSQFGMALGVDWQMASRIGLYADFAMGLTGIFPNGFTTVEQTLLPLYATIGAYFQL